MEGPTEVGEDGRHGGLVDLQRLRNRITTGDTGTGVNQLEPILAPEQPAQIEFIEGDTQNVIVNGVSIPVSELSTAGLDSLQQAIANVPPTRGDPSLGRASRVLGDGVEFDGSFSNSAVIEPSATDEFGRPISRRGPDAVRSAQAADRRSQRVKMREEYFNALQSNIGIRGEQLTVEEERAVQVAENRSATLGNSHPEISGVSLASEVYDSLSGREFKYSINAQAEANRFLSIRTNETNRNLRERELFLRASSAELDELIADGAFTGIDPDLVEALGLSYEEEIDEIKEIRAYNQDRGAEIREAIANNDFSALPAELQPGDELAAVLAQEQLDTQFTQERFSEMRAYGLSNDLEDRIIFDATRGLLSGAYDPDHPINGNQIYELLGMEVAIGDLELYFGPEEAAVRERALLDEFLDAQLNGLTTANTSEEYHRGTTSFFSTSQQLSMAAEIQRLTGRDKDFRVDYTTPTFDVDSLTREDLDYIDSYQMGANARRTGLPVFAPLYRNQQASEALNSGEGVIGSTGQTSVFIGEGEQFVPEVVVEDEDS